MILINVLIIKLYPCKTINGRRALKKMEEGFNGGKTGHMQNF